VRWLPSLEGKGVLEDSTRRATASAGAYAGTAYQSNWNVQRAVRDGYERVIWVFRAVDHIASSACRLPFQLRVGDETGPVAEGVAGMDPILRLLNRLANAWEPAAAFRYRLSSQLLLSKKGAFIEVIRSRRGDPIALHLLPCGDTSPVPDPVRFVAEFEVTVNGVPERIPAYEEDGVTPHVLWIRKPHPTDPYSGVTPMEAAGISIDMDFFARLYNKSFLQNDGRPGGLLAIKGKTDPEDKDELRRRFGGGPSQAGRTSVISAEDANWLDTAITPRDAQFAEIMRITKTDILDAFGVYESLIGNASGRTFDNAGQESKNFWQETMPPHLDMIAGWFDYLTAGGIEDDLYLVHDVEGVPILQKAREDREKALKELFEAGLITADEFREETGRDPFDTPGTRTLWIAGTKRSIDAPAPAPVPAVQASAQGIGVKEAEVPREVKALTSSASEVERRVEARTGDFRKVMRRYFNRQERVVLERLSGVKARRDTPLWDPPGTKAVEVGDVLDTERWDRELGEDLEPVVSGVYEEEAEDAGVEVDDDDAQPVLASRLGHAADINATTAGALGAALVVGDGETADDVRRRVKDLYEEARTTRADLIAETEAAGATNDARDLIAEVVGADRKKWRSRGDSRVRETHQKAHGQERDVGERFTVGGATLKYPGDPAAPVKEIARCRCWVEYLSPDMGSG
jgi:HK97 family phage portal protein